MRLESNSSILHTRYQLVCSLIFFMFGRKKVKEATQVELWPLGKNPPIDERYLTDTLQGKLLMKDQTIEVSYFGGKLTYKVLSAWPKADEVLVTQNTLFQISNENKSKYDSAY